MPKSKAKNRKRPAAVAGAARGSASRRAFVKRYGPMKIHSGYGYDIEDYASTQRDWWTVWEAARTWQRQNQKEQWPNDPSSAKARKGDTNYTAPFAGARD